MFTVRSRSFGRSDKRARYALLHGASLSRLVKIVAALATAEQGVRDA
jgi:hypothetical protein